jgi:hypothetical protein
MADTTPVSMIIEDLQKLGNLRSRARRRRALQISRGRTTAWIDHGRDRQ